MEICICSKIQKNDKVSRGIFMFRDEQLEQTELYERKMQLVQAVRAENHANKQRIQHRNNIFYSSNDLSVSSVPYDNNVDTQQKNSMYIRKSFLAIRICISVFCVVAFWSIKNGKLQGIVGVNAKEIKAYVAQDFSKVVVDYMKNITYTLNYEKTSIK